jgi:pyruvate/2-oxoglutarate dehydrogenase complex dihydrolipoamide dehydrogenase (E3) component
MLVLLEHRNWVLAVIEKESLGGVCLNWGVSQQKHY